MAKVTKRIPNDRPWPDYWDVSFSRSVNGRRLESRKHDFMVADDRDPQWYTFERYVFNTRTRTDWVDAFAQKPFGAFVSFRPERITSVRNHTDVVSS